MAETAAPDRILRVALTGAGGQMGREVVKALQGALDLALVAAVSPRHAGRDAGELAGIGPLGLIVEADLATALAATAPDVLVDFTRPEAVMGVARTAIAAGVRPVIGSTGLGPADLAELERLAGAHGVGVLVAPNFAIGALLMIRFAAEAARYFDHAEVIELHHDRKHDAPSGTALKTLEAMAGARPRFEPPAVPGEETLPGVRGGERGGVHVHSVRLPGLLAHQEVLLGGQGQLLTIRHDALSRECYMPGVLLGVRKVMTLSGLVYGLEQVM